jgi:hypothetical protein
MLPASFIIEHNSKIETEARRANRNVDIWRYLAVKTSVGSD